MMVNNRPEIGDIVMLLRPEIVELPTKVRRGRPPKVPRIETKTTWHDDVEAIIISGPMQGISSDGEDYWLEWVTQRLDDGRPHVITSSGRWTGSNWRIIQRVNSNA
jgi:hypothetical protein